MEVNNNSEEARYNFEENKNNFEVVNCNSIEVNQNSEDVRYSSKEINFHYYNDFLTIIKMGDIKGFIINFNYDEDGFPVLLHCYFGYIISFVVIIDKVIVHY